MTAIAAVWDNGGVILAADSRASDHSRPVRKIWRMGSLWLAFAGDAAVAARLQHEAAHPSEEAGPPKSVEECLWSLLDRLRGWAFAAGLTRDGAQGQKFVSATIIATDGARAWRLEDGWSVEEIFPRDAIIGGGDRTAVEAAYFAAIAGGARPGRHALEIAMHAVMQVWNGAGPPLVVVDVQRQTA